MSQKAVIISYLENVVTASSLYKQVEIFMPHCNYSNDLLGQEKNESQVSYN